MSLFIHNFTIVPHEDINCLLAVDATLQLNAGEMRLDRQDLRLQQDLQNSKIQGRFLLRFQLSLWLERQSQVIRQNA
jgi:hypothetical protein